MIPKENGAPAIATQGPDMTKLNTGKPIEPSRSAQAKIELLADDLTANVSAMRWTLETALASLNEPGVEVAGTLYALRRAKAYWRAIGESARDLAAAEAARRSALRQSEETR